MQIFCDFDGTISKSDTADYILNLLAAPEWKDIEKQWESGAIGSSECMRQQIALIDATWQQLNNALDEIEIDPNFQDFINFCNTKGLPVTIISDGVDYFINRILSRHGLDNLPIIANHLVASGNSSYELKTPNSSPFCESASGVCKCRMVEGYNMRIYVGDGRSDFCVADKVDLIFAKDKLAKHCEENGINYVAYENFADVTNKLSASAEISISPWERVEPYIKERPSPDLL